MSKRRVVKVKRVYDAPGPEDGARVLVDRLWPRGLSREQAGLDLWLKDIAPSDSLRTWFAHDPAKWGQFCARYARELDENPEAVEALLRLVHRGPVTLLFGAKDEEHNNAVALRDYLASPRTARQAAASRETP